MRYNQRAVFEDGTELAVNLTNMGAEAQRLVFGDTKQGRVVARFYPAVSTRKGWFSVAGTKYLINRNVTTGRRTALYGVPWLITMYTSKVWIALLSESTR